MGEWTEQHRDSYKEGQVIIHPGEEAWIFFNMIKCCLLLSSRHLWASASSLIESLWKRKCLQAVVALPTIEKKNVFTISYGDKLIQEKLHFGVTVSYWTWAFKNLESGSSIRPTMTWRRIRENLKERAPKPDVPVLCTGQRIKLTHDISLLVAAEPLASYLTSKKVYSACERVGRDVLQSLVQL